MTSHALDLLAEFVAKDDAALSDTARRWVEAAMVDTLGCILAGSRYPVAVNARRAACQLGAGDVSILGTGETASPAIAAFANAVAGHSSDFDDWEIPGNTHPSVVMIPALLAVGATAPASGEATVRAYVAGFEVIARLGKVAAASARHTPRELLRARETISPMIARSIRCYGMIAHLWR